MCSINSLFLFLFSLFPNFYVPTLIFIFFKKSLYKHDIFYKFCKSKIKDILNKWVFWERNKKYQQEFLLIRVIVLNSSMMKVTTRYRYWREKSLPPNIFVHLYKHWGPSGSLQLTFKWEDLPISSSFEECSLKFVFSCYKGRFRGKPYSQK